MRATQIFNSTSPCNRCATQADTMQASSSQFLSEAPFENCTVNPGCCFVAWLQFTERYRYGLNHPTAPAPGPLVNVIDVQTVRTTTSGTPEISSQPPASIHVSCKSHTGTRAACCESTTSHSPSAAGLMEARAMNSQLLIGKATSCSRPEVSDAPLVDHPAGSASAGETNRIQSCS